MIKIKTLKIFLVAFILAFSMINSYQRPSHAESLTDIPGYTDELVKGVFMGIATAVAGATHAAENVQDNVNQLYDAAVATYNTWSPTAKEAFLSGIDFYSGHIKVTASFLSDLLSGELNKPATLKPEYQQFYYSDSGIRVPRGYDVVVRIPAIKLSGNDVFTISNSQYENNYIAVYPFPPRYAGNPYVLDVSRYVGDSGATPSFTSAYGQVTESAVQAMYDARVDGGGIASFFAMIHAAGGSVSIKKSNTTIELSNDFLQQGSSYPTSTKENFDRAVAAGGLTLGLPQAVPYSNTGKPLDVTGTGVLLDGAPYTGGIEWKDTVLGAGTSDVIANLPLLYLDGKPLHWVTTADGSTKLVTGDGTIVNDLSSVQTMPNDVIYVDGVPHAMTSTGALVNLKTGEITAKTPEATIPGEVTGLWAKLWEWLKSILDVLKGILAAIVALPLKLLELLKAMLLALFVPSEGFWTDNLNNLKSLLWGDTIDDLTGEFGDLSGASGGSFKDVIVTLMGVKDLVVIDADSVNTVLDYIHKWVRGVIYPFILIYNINMLYKLIRGTSLVEVTRSMRYKAGD